MTENPLEILLRRMEFHGSLEAIIWHDQSVRYGQLSEEVEHWRAWLLERHVSAGTVVFFEADFCPSTIAFLLALWRLHAIVVPFAQPSSLLRGDFLRISQSEVIVSFDSNQGPVLEKTEGRATHVLYQQLRQVDHPGLVLFSSGSSGPPKGAVHDVYNLLAKVNRIQPRHQRTLAFLILDHLGGIDTLLYTLANCGCLVVPRERTPDGILAAIEKHQVDLLPTSPSFLNLVLLSGAYERHKLDSLKKLSYGAEPMPEGTLKRFHELFPHIKMTQTYALTELGVLRTVSENSKSLWMQVGGDDHETRVREGVLEVRSPYMMLGYLNAPSPMTDDGWFITGDLVETSGGLLKVRGRQSDVINVGGEKVNPIEVEEAIREMAEVADVLVYGEANPILGQVVVARVVPRKGSALESISVRKHCLDRLPKAMVPVRIIVSEEDIPTNRHKRSRKGMKGEKSE